MLVHGHRGIGNVVQTGKPIPDLDIRPRGPWRVERVPESGIWTRPNLRRTVYAFGRILEDHGAGVAVVTLAPDTQGNRHEMDYPNTSLAGVLAPHESMPLSFLYDIY